MPTANRINMWRILQLRFYIFLIDPCFADPSCQAAKELAQTPEAPSEPADVDQAKKRRSPSQCLEQGMEPLSESPNVPTDSVHHSPIQPRETSNEAQSMSLLSGNKQVKNDTTGTTSSGSNFNSNSTATSTLAHHRNDSDHMSPGLGASNVGQVDEHHYQQQSTQEQHHHHHQQHGFTRNESSSDVVHTYHHSHHPISLPYPSSPNCGGSKTATTGSGANIYNEQNNIVAPMPPTSSSTSSSPTSLSHHHHQSTESMPMIPFEIMKRRSPTIPGFGMNGDVVDRCGNGNGSNNDICPPPPLQSPGGYSSNKSFCSGLEGDSPPSPMHFNNNHPATYQWMKQGCYGTLQIIIIL